MFLGVWSLTRRIRKENDGWICSNDKRKVYGKSAEIRADL